MKYCKFCKKEIENNNKLKRFCSKKCAHKQYIKNHPEKDKIYKQREREKRKKHYKKWKHQWYIEHKKEIISTCKECGKIFNKGYKYCSSECMLKYNYKKFSRTLKGKINRKLTKAKRREKQNNLIHGYTKKEFVEKLMKTEGYCFSCKKYIGLMKLTADHTPSISKAKKGFIYTINNMNFLCMSCNNRKK